MMEFLLRALRAIGLRQVTALDVALGVGIAHARTKRLDFMLLRGAYYDVRSELQARNAWENLRLARRASLEDSDTI